MLFSKSKGSSSGKGAEKKIREKSSSKNDKKNTPDLLEKTLALEDLEFLWQIDDYEAKVGAERYLVTSSEYYDCAQYWFPPRKRSEFDVIRKGACHRFSQGKARSRNSEGGPPRVKEYDVASLAFQPRQDNFLALKKDCTEVSLPREGKEGDGWLKIGFHHHKDILCSEIDFVGGQPGLIAPAGNSSWMPQVLPTVYDCFDRDFDDENPGGLCGKLALIIGMIAFSAAPDLAESVVQQCFRLGSWTGHRQESGRYEGRIVVVKIYLEEDSDTQSRHLKALEKGDYGPILKDLSPSSATAFSQSYSTGRTAILHTGSATAVIPRSFAPYTSSTQPNLPVHTSVYAGPSNTNAQNEPLYVEDDDDGDGDGDGNGRGEDLDR